MNEKLLKAKDVAERLNVSVSKAFSLMRNGDIRTVRFGRSVRVRAVDLDSFIACSICDIDAEPLNTKPAVVPASLEFHRETHSGKQVTLG